MKKQKENLVKYWKGNNVIRDEKVIEAFMKIPRENFVLNENLHEAYGDYPLDINYGATISQPTTVVIMLEALDVKKGDKILEIGTGSGYTATLLSVLVGNKGKIYSIDIIRELVYLAKNNLKKLKIKNVKIIHEDGSKGLKKYAPYDRIIVTCACKEVPKPLIKQLKDKGILLIPVGSRHVQQMMNVISYVVQESV